MGTLRRAYWLFAIYFASLYHVALAQVPIVQTTRFKNLPIDLTYFEDSSTVVYHDVMAGDVWISDDEGKNWRQVADVPTGQAMMFFAHPFARDTAFILTKDETHYRTTDFGKTWQSFNVPASPALVSDPLSFHSQQNNTILYQGMVCEKDGWWGGNVCHDETFYTTDAFTSPAKPLLAPTRSCRFAHSSKDFKHSAHSDLVFCVAWDSNSSRSSKLFSSTDFFANDKRVVNLPGGNRDSDGVVALAIVSKFAVAAVKDLSPGNGDEMFLYVSIDAETWAKGRFPHASSSQLRENAYTIVESTIHSLAVDVLLHPKSAIGTLFVSNSNGTNFVESLQNTNRNFAGFVDYENIYGVEGVGLANVVDNAVEVDGRNAERIIKSYATFDDGSNWAPIPAPDSSGDIDCDRNHPSKCSLHLHSVTSPHNFGRVFSSPAPGFVLGVGTIGNHLLPYDQCDTFLSTDAGLSWRMVHKDAHKYEFGDQGSVMVIVNDEEAVDHVSYSYDSGKTWQDLNLDVKIRARVLTTVPDSTSQKFLLVGTLHKSEHNGDNRPHAAVFLDFAPLRKEQCTQDQFEKWYARAAKDKECLMGHKQWYNRKKPDANCYIGNKFTDPEEHEDNCPCDEDDYECDFNFIREGDDCVPQGPEPIPTGVCEDPSPGKTYLGSSGYRLIPGNTCDQSRGPQKDKPIRKDCSKAQLPPGEISHQTFEFPGQIVQHEYFKESKTILVRLRDGTVWQSSNEGYTWRNPLPDQRFLAFYMHRYSPDRAYLITNSDQLYVTINTGQSWELTQVNHPANTLGIPVMSFHPQESDWIIWIGGTPGCSDYQADCHTEAAYTTNNGRSWASIESYVKNCAWGRDTDLKIDSQLVICESYRDKKGSQALFTQANPLELWIGSHFYREKRKLFDSVVGFTKFSEYLIVAELQIERMALDLQVSLDGRTFASGLFPPSMRPDNHAYTVLESSTDSVFLHLTMSDRQGAEFGNILKSNSNGTFYGVSIEHVNRNPYGYVDFEKMIGLDGIALVNVLSNPEDAPLTGHKTLQSRITHNDGGTWKPLTPPKVDANKQKYSCTSSACALQVHGYTERWDPRATYSTPSVPGLLLAVGNVGEQLAPYTESDTFLSRDAGFTWEEVHKGAHLWEFGDSGSILVMTNDEEPTDYVLFSTDEGLTWNDYTFGQKMRVKSIVTVPADTSRKFILFGYNPLDQKSSLAVHVDFSALTRKQCERAIGRTLVMHNSEDDDFELWSPSEEREERCLFGRQTLYHRRIRDRDCYVGEQIKQEVTLVQNCTCAATDFECEFNYVRDANGNCVLGAGLSPLPSDDYGCRLGDDFWYERTAYRKIPYSSCTGGNRPDRGEAHICPGPRAHGFGFWFSVLIVPFAVCGLVGWWYTKKSGLARGTIRLPDRRGSFGDFSDAGPLATLASVPYFILGLAGIAWEYVLSRMPPLQSRRGYRNVPVDEDAQVLRFEDEEE
ncbi:Oligoxyloglucan reducing end-specific cellobiohydrolase [Gautieria morchelliformis]|nr:Oligoxyloglucan reducing end-specific cellobiohydrolase [Gautieria morchelliformis]